VDKWEWYFHTHYAQDWDHYMQEQQSQGHGPGSADDMANIAAGDNINPWDPTGAIAFFTGLTAQKDAAAKAAAKAQEQQNSQNSTKTLLTPAQQQELMNKLGGGVVQSLDALTSQIDLDTSIADLSAKISNPDLSSNLFSGSDLDFSQMGSSSFDWSGTADAATSSDMGGGGADYTNLGFSSQPSTLWNDLMGNGSSQPGEAINPLITVGKEGSRGFWGVAQSMLPAGSSNADVEKLALQLMTANPGVTTLHVGDVLNEASDGISSQALQTYGGMNKDYQLNLQMQREAAAADPNFDFKTAAGLVPATQNTPINEWDNPNTQLPDFNWNNSNQSAGSTHDAVVSWTADWSNRLSVGPGYLETTYDNAVAGYSNPNNSWFERGVNFVGATLMFPVTAAEVGTRGVLNIPSAALGAFPLANQAGSEFGVVFDGSQSTENRVIGGLGAIRDTAFAFTGLGGPATLMSPTASLETAPLTGEQLALQNFNRADSTAALATYSQGRTALPNNWAVDAEAGGWSQYDIYKTSNGEWDWPANNGAVPGTSSAIKYEAGELIDRYGPNDGTYLSPFGTDYTARSLAPGSLASPYRAFEVVTPYTFTRSLVAPAFGETGYGYQLQIPRIEGTRITVQDLLDNGVLREHP